MLATAIIVFREVLEAALIVGIVLAATKGLAKCGLWVSAGIGVGLGGAALVAMFAGAIAGTAAGMGQEVFNASVLFIAVVMLGWHNVWMGRHGRDMAQQMNAVGRAVTLGSRPMYVLAVVVGLAVLREGAEVVLFLYGIAIAQQEQAGLMLAGGVLGLLLGMGAGLLLYLGLLRISSKRLFIVTSWLIALLAAGMAAQGAGFLVQADLLPSLVQPLWDTSALLSQHSIPGRILQTLIGYADRPAGMQVVFYVVTLAVIGVLMWFYGSPLSRSSLPRTARAA
ncbi:MAG TPA: FTR1 family protein [Acidiferrobacterales bacterium]|nr:FTR1 family protein [Acidiferrobacterales bacterium]